MVDNLGQLQDFRTLSGPELKLVFADDGVLTAAIGPPKWTPLDPNVRSWCAASLDPHIVAQQLRHKARARSGRMGDVTRGVSQAS